MRSGAGTRAAALAAAIVMCVPSRVAAAPDDPAVAEAEELFRSGKIKYEASNYVEALALFTQAFERAAEIEDEAERESVMTGMLYNLARAHRKAYEIDGDTSHLRHARDLLKKYLDKHTDLGDELDAEKQLLEVEALLAKPEKPDEESTQGEDAVPTSSTTDEPKTNGLVIGGIVLSSLSAVGFGLLTGGLVIGSRAEQDYADGPTRDDRDDALARGKQGNALAIAGGVAAAVFLGTGVALITVGKKRGPNKVAIAPAVRPGSMGVALCGRF